MNRIQLPGDTSWLDLSADCYTIPSMPSRSFGKPASSSGTVQLSWTLVAYTLVIIAWGAWVRISGSGDGCGDSWPLCHGAAVPIGAGVKTWIEVSHRYSTALFGILILIQAFFLWRTTEKGHSARIWVMAVLLFTLTEALIGRLLVKEGLVNESVSLYRLLVMPLHLLNTSLLLFAQVMTAESVARAAIRTHPLSLKKILIAVVALATLLTTGAIAALGSHLMPAASLVSGLAQDFHQLSHPAVRLRIIHPLLGLAIPAALYFVYLLVGTDRVRHTLLPYVRHLVIATLLMVVVGVCTLLTLAPTWLKILHLTLANVIVVLVSRLYFHIRYNQDPEGSHE